MTNTQDALDAMMGFDPANTNPFVTDEAPKSNPNIYKTNPKDSKEEDGIYRSKVRVIYNPYNYGKSIVSKTEWYCSSDRGSFMVNGLLDTKENRRICPLFQASSKVFLALDDFAEKFAAKSFPNDVTRRNALLDEFNAVQGRGKEAWAKKFKETELGQLILNYGKETFDNTTSTWALVQILEDNNKPELVGRFMMMKLPKVVASKIEAKQYPTKESGKKPIDLMSWVLGYPLEMEVKPGESDDPIRRQREISYELCDFSTDFEPIRKVDGTPLFTDEQLEILEEFATARKDADTAKAAKKRQEAAEKIAVGSELYVKVRELTGIALNYLTEEAKVLDIVDEITYKPWDEATTKRVQEWIDDVTLVNFTAKNDTTSPAVAPAADEAPMPEVTNEEVPF